MPVKSFDIFATLVISAASLYVPQAQCAESAREYAKTNAAVSAYREFFGITGGAVAILRGGEVIYRDTFGFANVEFGVPVKSDTRFQLSSSTKLFTGTLMTMLARDGVVDYSRPVRRYLSDLPESWSDVLLEDVMSHLSGLPEILECDENDNLDAALRCVYRLERPAMRREKFSYNQTNYLLAMRVIETVSGASFPELLSRRIFGPAGMSSALLNGDSRDVIHKRATDYYPNATGGIKIRAYEFPVFLLSAAGMNASLDDMIAFAIAIDGDKLLDQNWKSRMWRAPELTNGNQSHYALGWDLGELRGTAVSVGHEGGSLNTFRIYPEFGLTVIVLTNGMHKRFGLDGFADVLAQSIDPEILTPLDSAAYRAKLTFMIGGLEAMSVLIQDQLCESELDNDDCREMLTWLAEELAEDGYAEDAAKLLELFGPEYGL